MTKDQEIETLNAFIQTLPQDSYLRPWLEYVLPEITQDITNDIYPTVTPSEAMRQSVEILTLAVKDAEETRASAQREANRLAKQASETIESARDYGRQIAKRAQDAVSALGAWNPKY